MHSLPIFVRLGGRPVILLGDGEAADAKRRLLERAGAVVAGEEAAAALAIVAIDDDKEAEAAVARLKARGVLVNAVDRPALCDFTLPAIVDRDPVLIAIGTGGASAGLAKALRQRFETLLPASLGRLADALNAARVQIRALWPDAAVRRQAIDDALETRLDPFADHADDAVTRWLGSARHCSHDEQIVMMVAFDPDAMTLGGARWLARADTVIYDPGVNPAILARARADALRLPASDQMPSRGGITVYLKVIEE